MIEVPVSRKRGERYQHGFIQSEIVKFILSGPIREAKEPDVRKHLLYNFFISEPNTTKNHLKILHSDKILTKIETSGSPNLWILNHSEETVKYILEKFLLPPVPDYEVIKNYQMSGLQETIKKIAGIPSRCKSAIPDKTTVTGGELTKMMVFWGFSSAIEAFLSNSNDRKRIVTKSDNSSPLTTYMFYEFLITRCPSFFVAFYSKPSHLEGMATLITTHAKNQNHFPKHAFLYYFGISALLYDYWRFPTIREEITTFINNNWDAIAQIAELENFKIIESIHTLTRLYDQYQIIWKIKEEYPDKMFFNQDIQIEE